ncbi:MAG: hypothetical protein JWM11_4203 [Planctomycetaceae bacterium]|nr:hypothetical protein [Planctomycetaceae bacterium]
MSAQFLIGVRRRPAMWMIGGTLASLAVSGYFYITHSSSPESRLAQSRKLSTHPTQALVLVRSAIRATQGNFPEAQILECQLLLALNRGREASGLFSQIRDPENCDPEELCQLAEQAQTAGELALSSHAFLAAGELVHRSPKRLKCLIFVLYSQSDNETYADRILKLCRDYARLESADPFPWLVSASLYHERGIPNLAAEAYRGALKCQLPPEELFRVRFQLIQLSMLLGDLLQARENCTALLAESQSSASLRNVNALNAELLLREGKSAEAREQFDKLLEANPEWTKVLALRGKCRFELNDLPGAIRDLSQAAQQNDFDQQSHYLLGQAYLKQKDAPRANQHLNRSRELNELIAQIFTLENQLRNDLHNRELKLRLAELNDRRGDKEKAAAWRRGAEKLAPPAVQ